MRILSGGSVGVLCSARSAQDSSQRDEFYQRRTRRSEKGVALLIVLFMVSFLLVFVAANSNALFGLRREIKLVDQKQKARWSEISTNRVDGARRPAVCDTADGAVCVTVVEIRR